MKKVLLSIIVLTISFTTFSQNWDEMIKAVSSDRAEEDYFGYNVVIEENRAVISSYLEDEDILGGATMLSAGSVYVFELMENVWTETAKIVASDRAADDRFGARVAMSGERIIVGAFLEDEDATGGATLNEAGSAYIFDLIGGVWTETAKIVASDRAAGYRFGFDVDISGNQAIIGSYYNATDTSGGDPKVSAGAAYIFELSGGVWMETAKIVASDRDTYNYFGYSVCMDGTTVIVGAQGNKTDTSGVNYLSNAGAVYVFDLIGGAWTETIKLVASDRGTDDNFGFDASINNNRVVVGAYKDGEDVTGGNTLVEAGSAYVFEFIGGVWTETTKLVASDRDANNQFGNSIDISGDNIIIGSRFESTDVAGGNLLTESGSAYIFEFSGGVWLETNKLVSSDRGANDNFGTRVSISGNKAIVGALFEDEDAVGGNTLYDAGSVYIFNTCIANPNVIASGNTLSATANGSVYQWIDCDNGNTIISSETNQSFTPTVSGNYAVIVIEGNCSDTSACMSIAIAGINDLELKNESLILYPNPTNSQINIQIADKTEAINIVDLTGKIVKNMPSNTTKIDVSDLTNGIYFIQVKTENDLLSKMFIKE